jgi:hypothetical protein
LNAPKVTPVCAFSMRVHRLMPRPLNSLRVQVTERRDDAVHVPGAREQAGHRDPRDRAGIHVLRFRTARDRVVDLLRDRIGVDFVTALDGLLDVFLHLRDGFVEFRRMAAGLQRAERERQAVQRAAGADGAQCRIHADRVAARAGHESRERHADDVLSRTRDESRRRDATARTTATRDHARRRDAAGRTTATADESGERHTAEVATSAVHQQRTVDATHVAATAVDDSGEMHAGHRAAGAVHDQRTADTRELLSGAVQDTGDVDALHLVLGRVDAESHERAAQILRDVRQQTDADAVDVTGRVAASRGPQRRVDAVDRAEVLVGPIDADAVPILAVAQAKSRVREADRHVSVPGLGLRCGRFLGGSFGLAGLRGGRRRCFLAIPRARPRRRATTDREHRQQRERTHMHLSVGSSWSLRTTLLGSARR